jgi:NAD(P)-dependent dehydrogenase (short-subunit alcohol dehydrogenase family)
MPRLAGKAAIVTGGALGIGRHYALALAAEGAKMTIADIADGKPLADEIAGEHGADAAASAITDVSIASGAPYKGVPRMLPYVTSKGAIIAFTRALSRELGAYGIVDGGSVNN